MTRLFLETQNNPPTTAMTSNESKNMAYSIRYAQACMPPCDTVPVVPPMTQPRPAVNSQGFECEGEVPVTDAKTPNMMDWGTESAGSVIDFSE